MTSELSHRFQEGMDYAFELHGAQSRKGSHTPYIGHLLSVAGLVLEAGGDEDEAIAALLHDAVEDQGGQATLEAIRTRFGDRVAEIVTGCSDTDQKPKPPWRERKEAYIAHLASASPSVLRVSLADKIHNARDILLSYRQLGDEVWMRFKGGKEGTLWYYHAVAGAYRLRLKGEKNVWVDELERVIDQIEAEAGGNQDKDV